MVTRALKRFLAHEAAGGIILVVAALLAMLVQNSAWGATYSQLLHLHLGVHAGTFSFSLSVEEWINDGLMVVFFLLVGMEIKRELIRGELSTTAQRVLPTFAALGGMAVPACIYWGLNHADTTTHRGWAIPSATDIAFSLGVLTLLGRRVPISLKVFLTALAIIDDLGAIIIIALFYSDNLHLNFVFLTVLVLVTLYALNRTRVTLLSPYLLLGLLLWLCVLHSGIHATIAGVLLGLCIPLRAKQEQGRPPLLRLADALHPWVAYGILPLFAFANAGVDLSGISLDSLFHPVTLGIALGLFIGKQVGVFGVVWALINLGLSQMPKEASWHQVYGVAILAGIGFTMSLFIGTLSFSSEELAVATRMGVLLGSGISAIVGYLILKMCPVKS